MREHGERIEGRRQCATEGVDARWRTADETRCLAASSSVFGNSLEHANNTDGPERIYLALGDLAPSYVGRLRVRVRVFRAAANDRCETARCVAPNTILTGEVLT